MTYHPSKEICESSMSEDTSHVNKKYYVSNINQKVLCEDCMTRIYDEITKIIDYCIRQYQSGAVDDYALSTWREVEQRYCETVNGPYCIFGIGTILVTIIQRLERSNPSFVYSGKPEVRIRMKGVDDATGSSMLFSLTSAYNYDALRMMVEQILKTHLSPLSESEVDRLQNMTQNCFSIE